jgi:hypothetical protein
MLIEKASFMKGKWIWLLLVVLVAGGAAGYLTRDRESPPLAQYRSVARHVLSTHTKHQPPENRITACSSADCKAVAAVLQPEAKEKKEAAEKEEIYTFSADADGNLVLNEKTPQYRKIIRAQHAGGMRKKCRSCQRRFPSRRIGRLSIW